MNTTHTTHTYTHTQSQYQDQYQLPVSVPASQQPASVPASQQVKSGEIWSQPVFPEQILEKVLQQLYQYTAQASPAPAQAPNKKFMH